MPNFAGLSDRNREVPRSHLLLILTFLFVPSSFPTLSFSLELSLQVEVMLSVGLSD